MDHLIVMTDLGQHREWKRPGTVTDEFRLTTDTRDVNVWMMPSLPDRVWFIAGQYSDGAILVSGMGVVYAMLSDAGFDGAADSTEAAVIVREQLAGRGSRDGTVRVDRPPAASDIPPLSWIPISERLPVPGVRVLVWVPDSRLDARGDVRFGWTVEGGVKWVVYRDTQATVTHWRAMLAGPS